MTIKATLIIILVATTQNHFHFIDESINKNEISQQRQWERIKQISKKKTILASWINDRNYDSVANMEKNPKMTNYTAQFSDGFNECPSITK